MQRKVFSENKVIENIGKQTNNSSCLERFLLCKKSDNSRLEVLNKKQNKWQRLQKKLLI